MVMSGSWLENSNPEHKKEVWVKNSWLGVKRIKMVMNPELNAEWEEGHAI